MACKKLKHLNCDGSKDRRSVLLEWSVITKMRRVNILRF